MGLNSGNKGETSTGVQIVLHKNMKVLKKEYQDLEILEHKLNVALPSLG